MDAPNFAPLNLGLIGLGQAGRAQLQATSCIASINVVALSEVVAPPALKNHAGVPLYKDWRELLNDPAVEAVSICLPHHLHEQAAIAALEADKHVLLEKPLASTLEAARRIVAAAHAARRVLMVEMTHRFYPPVRAGRDLIAAGRLGQIYAVEDRIIQGVPPGSLAPWLFQRQFAGGGVALTNGIHMLDRIAWVCDQPLRFHSGVAGWTQQLGDIEDTATMQLALQDGTPVSLLAAWPCVAAPLDDELTIYGTRGTLRIWAWRGWRFEPHDGAAEEHSGYEPEDSSLARAYIGMGGALREFAAAIEEKRVPNPAPEQILAAQELVEQFYDCVGVTGSVTERFAK